MFFVALVWRLAYLGRLANTPLGGSIQGDARVYWDWATFLLDHRFVAQNPFFLGPLYPHALALVRALAGSEVHVVLTLQAVLGAGACALLTDAARRLVSPGIAIAVGLVMACYGMAVFFDGLILMESLVLTIEVVILWLWCRQPFGLRMSLAAGAAIGVASLGRATGALLLLPTIWIAVRAPVRRTRAHVRVAVALVAFVLAVAPATISNWRTSGAFIPFTYNFGYNLYVGNNPEATGSSVWIGGARSIGAASIGARDGGGEGDGRDYLERTEGVRLSPVESSLYWTEKAVDFASKNPKQVASLTVRKIALMWNHREASQFESADLYAQVAGPLGLPLIGTFLFVGVLGFVGLFHARGLPVVGSALQINVLLATLAVAPFFVTDRYRIHLVPALLLLGGLGVQAFLRERRESPMVLLRRFGLPLAAACALVLLPLLEQDQAATRWAAGRDLGTRWLEQGRPDLAAREFERALGLEGELAARGRLPEPGSRAQLYFNYGVALKSQGRAAESVDWIQRAAEAEPENTHFVRALADAYLLTGRTTAGDSLLSRLADLGGNTSQLSLSRGLQAAREGRVGDAELLFRSAVEADARNYTAWGALIRIQVQTGGAERAAKSVAEAGKTGMPKPTLKLYEALVAAAMGERARAAALLSSVPHTATDRDPILSRVRKVTEGLLAR